MRLKGINPIEQHLEKGVAALFGLALLGVLAWQFLGGQTTVKLGTTDVPITDAYQKIANEHAAKTDAQMRAVAQPPTQAEITKLTSGIENFQESLTKPVAPKEQLAAALDSAPLYPWKSGDGPKGTADAPFAEVTIPAPKNAVASSNMSTVGTSEASVPEVAKILPPAQPFDKASVTVEAIVDGAAIRKALEEDPDGNGPIRAIPKNWWENGANIIAVTLIRQTLNPDGTWSAAEKVPGMPGRAVFVDKLDSMNDAESLKNALKLASEQVELVRRTPYYQVSIGDPWVAPSERERMASQELGQEAEIKSLLRQHEDSLRKIERWEKQLSELGRPPAGGGGRPGGGGAGGGRPGAGPPSGGAPQPASNEELTRKRLQGNIDREKEKDAKTKTRLRELGQKVEDEPGTNPQTSDPDLAKPTKGEAALLENPSIRVWAHDVFVERGKTYRYQIAIVMANPYFGHSAAMVPAQAEKLAKSGIMRSAPSEWTEPVAVDRETYVFFTSATEDEPSTGANANTRAEIYQFKWGFWRRGWKELEPGDRVAAEIKVPDYSKVIAAAPSTNPDLPTTGGGGGGGRGHAGPPTSGAGGTDTASHPATPIPRVIVEVATNEMVLGVGHLPNKSASSGKATEVFVRTEKGNVRVVVPEAEKLDSAYVRVSKSADHGEKELNPPVEKPKSNLPTTNPSAPDRDIPSGGPGGRGGGG